MSSIKQGRCSLTVQQWEALKKLTEKLPLDMTDYIRAGVALYLSLSWEEQLKLVINTDNEKNKGLEPYGVIQMDKVGIFVFPLNEKPTKENCWSVMHKDAPQDKLLQFYSLIKEKTRLDYKEG